MKVKRLACLGVVFGDTMFFAKAAMYLPSLGVIVREDQVGHRRDLKQAIVRGKEAAAGLKVECQQRAGMRSVIKDDARQFELETFVGSFAAKTNSMQAAYDAAVARQAARTSTTP